MERAARAFVDAVQVGDLCSGVVAGVTAVGDVTVTVDGFADRPLGRISSSNLTRHRFGRARVEDAGVGRRVTGEVVAVDRRCGLIGLALIADGDRELWAFLRGVRRGDRCSGTVAAVERFGVFVDLDDGPRHPVFPGVGFISPVEVSWRRFDDLGEVVRSGQRLTAEVLGPDVYNGEVRLSLKALRPDPFRRFALDVRVGRALSGTVTALVPFGFFVRVADGVEGLVHRDEPLRGLQVGDDVDVVVTEIDLDRRRLTLARPD
ncbi:S1 RNA-binding domain-containing protein [Actinomadura roseirufa]|uniref:S1 RNA-binding domain-containing protein n=1 Tax=Actinomadura roseirufa TaxID=2094049 RepID=UPI0010413DE5|nr:S1 RNA-binding domain-containing protein [Actinomadura roseirufa]